MIDPSSRYARVQTLTFERSGRPPIVYLSRRFLPPPETLQTLANVEVTPSDRLDLVAARTLGDPLAFWRIADANRAMDPDELTDTVGRRLRVPIPQP